MQQNICPKDQPRKYESQYRPSDSTVFQQPSAYSTWNTNLLSTKTLLLTINSLYKLSPVLLLNKKTCASISLEKYRHQTTSVSTFLLNVYSITHHAKLKDYLYGLYGVLDY